MSTSPSPAADALRTVAELVHEAVEVTDDEVRILYVNPAWERLTGYTAAEVLGHTPRLLRSEFHPLGFYDRVADVARSAGRWAGEMISRRKDGTLFLALVTIVRNPVDASGRVTFTCIRRDLTGELRGVREHAERYAMALFASRDGLSDWDLRTGEIVVSDRYKELLAIDGSPDELAHRFRERIHPEDAAEFGRSLHRHLRSADVFWESEFRIVRPDGEVLTLQQRSFTLREADGSAVRLVAVVTDVTERKRSESMLFHSATHDALTDLPNRSLFVEHLRAAIGRAARHAGPAFCLLYIDLRHFKSINDACGHAVGDGVLRAVASRLRECTRPGDSVARLGGDEFAMLLDGVRSPAVADTAARRVLRAIERPIEVEGRSLEVTATIGVSLGDASTEVDQLVRAADSAMYEARELDHQAVRVATPDGAARSLRRARLGNALREALTRRQIETVFQPLVVLASGGIRGVEVLARWSPAEFGAVPPAEFVPIAEELGLAGRLGQVVLERSLEQLRAWDRAGWIDPEFRLHVNISPRQLLDPRLPSTLARLCELGTLPRDRLCFEITETALVDRPEVVGRTIDAIRALGVSFTLDDFGTGFSSLAHLRGFAVSGLKVDRSFVHRLVSDPVSRQIVAGLLTMTRALGLEVVAEGVESAEQAALLTELGCPLAQGYHYARPMPALQMGELLANRGLRA